MVDCLSVNCTWLSLVLHIKLLCRFFTILTLGLFWCGPTGKEKQGYTQPKQKWDKKGFKGQKKPSHTSLYFELERTAPIGTTAVQLYLTDLVVFVGYSLMHQAFSKSGHFQYSPARSVVVHSMTYLAFVRCQGSQYWNKCIHIIGHWTSWFSLLNVLVVSLRQCIRSYLSIAWVFWFKYSAANQCSSSTAMNLLHFATPISPPLQIDPTTNRKTQSHKPGHPKTPFQKTLTQTLKHLGIMG